MLNEFELEKEYTLIGNELYLPKLGETVTYKSKRIVPFCGTIHKPQQDEEVEIFLGKGGEMIFIHVPQVINDSDDDYYWKLHIGESNLYTPELTTTYHFENLRITEDSLEKINQKVKEWVTIHNEGKQQKSLELMFDFIHNHDLDTAEFIFKNIEPSRLNETLIVGLLTVTCQSSDKMPERGEWIKKVRPYLKDEMTDDQIDKMLIRLG